MTPGALGDWSQISKQSEYIPVLSNNNREGLWGVFFARRLVDDDDRDISAYDVPGEVCIR